MSIILAKIDVAYKVEETGTTIILVTKFNDVKVFI